MAPEVFINGTDADRATAELNKANTNLGISRDKTSGKLSASGTPATDAEKKLAAAINDPNIRVNLTTTNANNVSSIDGTVQPIAVGQFDGSALAPDGKVETSQFVNLGHAEKWEKVGGSNVGQTITHEINESYIGGQLSPGEKYSSHTFRNAHKAASQLDPPSGNARVEVLPVGSSSQSVEVVGPKGREILFFIPTK